MLDLAIDDRLFITTRLDAAIQELDLLFNTTNTELIGYSDFGVNMDQFLWALTPMVNEIKTYISSKIKNTLYLSTLDTNIDVQYYQGEVRSIYYISIEIYDDTTQQSAKKEYHFQ